MKNITKWILASAVCGLFSLASAQATTVFLSGMSYTADSPYLVGTVIPTVTGQSGGQAVRDAFMVNTLLAGDPQHPGCTQCQWTTLQGPPHNQTSTLWSHTHLTGPSATTTGAVTFDQAQLQPLITNGIVSITLTGTFQYLVAAYDGGQSGVAVFDISSFHAGDTINLYAFAFPDTAHPGDLIGNNVSPYGITTVTLLNPLGVPDGGTTVMLLGAGLGALGMVRRFLTR